MFIMDGCTDVNVTQVFLLKTVLVEQFHTIILPRPCLRVATGFFEVKNLSAPSDTKHAGLTLTPSCPGL